MSESLVWEQLPFRLVVIVGEAGGAPWSRPSWDGLSHVLDPVVAVAGSAAVRVAARERSGSWMRFGRLGWTEKSHAKWVIDSSKRFEFFDMELWAPSRAQCERDGKPPTLYLSLSPHPGVQGRPLLLIAGAPTLGSTSTFESAVLEIGRSWSASLVAEQTRTWILSGESSIGDLTASGLLRVGEHACPSTDSLRGNWKPFEPTSH